MVEYNNKNNRGIISLPLPIVPVKFVPLPVVVVILLEQSSSLSKNEVVSNSELITDAVS